MKFNKQVVTALLAGAALASAGAVIAKPNAQLNLSAEAPEKVQEEFSGWQEGKRLRGRKDKCYGIALPPQLIWWQRISMPISSFKSSSALIATNWSI